MVRLNRSLLADIYPHELTAPSEKQNPDDSKAIEICRENLRQLQLARAKYRVSNADAEPHWLSELSPQYLDPKMLICPADPTVGAPGVLTEGASDPTLPCSYLYEFRPDQKKGQEILLEIEGDMIPVVRCEHHLINLSVSGKLYRNGPQRNIYNKTAKVALMIQIQPSVDFPADFPAEVRKQMEEQLQKNNNVVKSTITQINPSDNLHETLEEQLGAAFLESSEGKALLKQLTPASIDQEELALLLGKPMPDLPLMALSGDPVKLETFRGKFVLVNLFPTETTAYGPKLQGLEKLLENYDTSQLQVVGISIDDSAKAIEAFKQKYQLSMPVWMDKNNQIQRHLNIQTLLNSNAAGSQTELITLLLNRELVVKDVFIDFDLQVLSEKIKQRIESKE